MYKKALISYEIKMRLYTCDSLLTFVFSEKITKAFSVILCLLKLYKKKQILKQL